MEQTAFANLASGQQEALKKMVSLLGPEGVAHLASQVPDAITARLEAFSSYENALLEHIQQRVEMAMGCALLKSQHQRVALAIPKLSGRAREWALTSGSSVDQAFPTWDEIEQQLSRVLSPPNHAYRVRSKFLTTRQGKKDLAGYVQELRALIAGMVAQPLPESVTVTVFMDGLRTGVVRTEVFRNHPTTFEEAMAVALNTEYNFKSARMVWSASQTLPRAHGPQLC
ncbi:Gag protein [Phytophthora cinnamomi]|uniref:Gag protein n=1 Tax=Phytophthora cinnamomi TaxID=4785 RepID=UPI00355AB008|nr:Gag protein [Phytophthora cinnamomi]